jgi:hypothetical protein
MRVVNVVIECNAKLVLCNLLVMETCAYVWLSMDGTEPNLGNLVAAMETKFGALSTPLLGVGEDKGSSFAQRLSKRFKIQALVSDNLPELDPEDVRTVEVKVVEELNAIFRELRSVGEAGNA